MPLLKLLSVMQSRPSGINVFVNTSDLTVVTPSPLFSLSLGGNRPAQTRGAEGRDEYLRYPGRVCSLVPVSWFAFHDNDMKGECLHRNQCAKERQEYFGYNKTLECPPHIRRDRNNRICCPFLPPGENKSLSTLSYYAELLFHQY